MTEAFFNYPLPMYGHLFGFSDPMGNKIEAEILKKLGAIEERLSRIEQLMASNEGPPK
jgi:hypothetical protein